MKEAGSTDAQIASTSESKPLDQQQHEVNISAASSAYRSPRRPNLPILDLMEGHAREDYLRTGVRLYDASIKCEWNAAKAILDEKPELVRYSLTKNGETALHIAASIKRSKHVEKFVKNLVGMMDQEELTLQNKSYNTALYLAAASGNIKTVRIMVEKNKALISIPGAQGIMPLYAAALFGNYEVVKYLYENSHDLCDDGWHTENRGWLLEKCVEADILRKKYPGLSSGAVLGILARKPDAFSETKTSIIKIKRSIISVSLSVLSFIGLKVGAPEKDGTALTLLKIIWEDILKKDKKDINNILRGPPDRIEQDNRSVSGRAIQAMQLEKLITEHVAKMEEETNNLITTSLDSPNQNTKQASVNEERVVQLKNLISERLVTMHDETQKIIKGPLELIKQDNIPISSEGDLVPQLQNHIFKHIASMYDETQKVIQSYGMKDQDQKLTKVIFQQIRELGLQTQKILKERRLTEIRYSSRRLFIAAEMGNTSFLVELIRQYPDLIWKVNDNHQSVFHIGVKYRHEGIYNLLYEIGSMKDLITPLKDANDNNMLHLAGKMATKERLAIVSGAALQMQRELLWFEEVRNMVPPYLRERKNKDGLTPRELFTEEHKELIREGEKWMKETASQCMVVAALIATIVFAAAFTVPGGYNQNDGIPIFYRKSVFVVFVVADAMSLFLSSASILAFLSILTSRYAERDFEVSLPRKLMLGLLTLFLSIATMVITFTISFFILYYKEMKWIPILMSVVAFMPVLLYIVLQYHVLADVIRSSYGSRYLFKPNKRVLYYVNTKRQAVSEL
ncbi:putative ankyrin repeat-containing domain, PGG domain, ankyrin repeat-containing domain superfamily [Helianthus debilis subsp. tardiflorus]